MKIKTVPIEGIKAGEPDGLEDGEFIVYPATFTRRPDSYGDVIAKGAFADTIREWKESGNTLPGLYGHRMDDPDFFVAGAIDMGEDDHGWWVKGAFDLESPKGRQVYRLVKGRRLSQLSFAYDVLEDGLVDLGDDETANELRKVKVHEFSFVPVGANQETSVVAIKALADSLKDGRTPVGVDKLREAHATLGELLAAAAGEAGEAPAKTSAPVEGAGGQDQEQASTAGPANDEEPERAKSEEPSRSVSADAYLAVIAIEEKGIPT